MSRSFRRRAAAVLAPGIALAVAASLPAPPARADDAELPPSSMTWTGILDEKSFQSLHELREDAGHALRGETIDLAGGVAYLSLPEGEAPFPGVVVIQEWWGLNDNIKHWTDRLAADGYAALAVDLYDGVVATTREQAYETMSSVKPERAYEILAAAHAFLADDERVRAPKRGCIGWCFGGGWSLNQAIAADGLDAAVIYYGRLVEDPDELAKIEARLLGVFGNLDEGIPPESVDAFAKGLEAAGVDHEILRYDANHAFANPSSARYDAESAEAAWAEVRRFLAETLREN